MLGTTKYFGFSENTDIEGVLVCNLIVTWIFLKYIFPHLAYTVVRFLECHYPWCHKAGVSIMRCILSLSWNLFNALSYTFQMMLFLIKPKEEIIMEFFLNKFLSKKSMVYQETYIMETISKLDWPTISDFPVKWFNALNRRIDKPSLLLLCSISSLVNTSIRI